MTIIKISLKEIFSHLKIVGTVNNTCTQRVVKSVRVSLLAHLLTE